MITAKVLAATLDCLTAIPFFPDTDGGRQAIGRELSRMCRNDQQLEWLGPRCVALFTRWPGMPGIRAVFCSRWNPADGVIFDSCADYPDGVPPENPADRFPKALTAAEQIRLIGHVVAPAAEHSGETVVPLLPGHIASNDQQAENLALAVIDTIPPVPPARLADLAQIRHLYSDEQYSEAICRLKARAATTRLVPLETLERELAAQTAATTHRTQEQQQTAITDIEQQLTTGRASGILKTDAAQ